MHCFYGVCRAGLDLGFSWGKVISVILEKALGNYILKMEKIAGKTLKAGEQRYWAPTAIACIALG